jgi:hypothetical protein
MNWQMKTTVEISEELYRRAEAQAALEGRKLKDLIEEGLRLVINPRRERRQPASLAELTRTARGVVNSGIPDLASNPKHLAGFGRDVRRHRDTEPLVALLQRCRTPIASDPAMFGFSGLGITCCVRGFTTRSMSSMGIAPSRT